MKLPPRRYTLLIRWWRLFTPLQYRCYTIRRPKAAVHALLHIIYRYSHDAQQLRDHDIAASSLPLRRYEDGAVRCCYTIRQSIAHIWRLVTILRYSHIAINTDAVVRCCRYERYIKNAAITVTPEYKEHKMVIVARQNRAVNMSAVIIP